LIMRDAVIISAVRTPVGKAGRGSLRNVRADDLAAIVIAEALARVPQLDAAEIADVILGCAMPEAEQGMNIARNAALRAGLPVDSAAMTINRYCASGLQSIAIAANSIRCGGADVILAGGVESMSSLPMGGNKIAPNPWLVEHRPGAYLAMGLTAERVATKYGITREAADEFSYQSHQKALAAIAADKFSAEIIPVAVKKYSVTDEARPTRSKSLFAMDEGPRADTSLTALAKLKPAFHAKGSVTAGNSSQTSDGAAAVIITSAERAAQLGVQPLARFAGYAYCGCEPEVMGIGPVYAVPRALKMAGVSLDDIGLIELNEAFAAQSLAVMQQLQLDPARVNVNGGAIALGHPLGCTGAKLTVSLLHEMQRRNVRYGLVTMCVGGGMGAAGIFELM
jgi:acetyl-CoA acyltransferase